MKFGLLELIWNAGPVVKGVLLLLFSMSVLSWAVISLKWVSFRTAAGQNKKFLELFWRSKSLDEIFGKCENMRFSPVAEVFKSGFRELQKLSAGDTKHGFEIDNLTRAMGRTSLTELSALEKFLTPLATTASSAPFIGLFGTVWGIMSSFREIGATGSANLAVVAPGISEALVATAIGLLAAIPASIFYNTFVQSSRRMTVEIEGFTQDFLNIVQRGIMGGRK